MTAPDSTRQTQQHPDTDTRHEPPTRHMLGVGHLSAADMRHSCSHCYTAAGLRTLPQALVLQLHGRISSNASNPWGAVYMHACLQAMQLRSRYVCCTYICASCAQKMAVSFTPLHTFLPMLQVSFVIIEASPEGATCTMCTPAPGGGGICTSWPGTAPGGNPTARTTPGTPPATVRTPKTAARAFIELQSMAGNTHSAGCPNSTADAEPITLTAEGMGNPYMSNLSPTWHRWWWLPHACSSGRGQPRGWPTSCSRRCCRHRCRCCCCSLLHALHRCHMLWACMSQARGHQARLHSKHVPGASRQHVCIGCSMWHHAATAAVVVLLLLLLLLLLVIHSEAPTGL